MRSACARSISATQAASGTHVEMVKAMIARGYDDRKIEKMLGGNALRVFRALWE